METLNSFLEPWYVDRNCKQRGIDWQFTTDDARINDMYAESGNDEYKYPVLADQEMMDKF